VRDGLIISTSRVEHETIKTVVQSGMLMNFRHNTNSENVIGLSIDLSLKTAKIIVKNLSGSNSVSITIGAMTIRKIKNHWLS
jgi:hypothetical protein